MSSIGGMKPHRNLVLITALALILGWGLGGWLYWQNRRQAGDNNIVADVLASPQQIESGYAQSLAGFLDAKEYDQYQISARSIARHYFSIQDYASAERVMLEVLVKVPADKVEHSSLLLLAATYKAAGNNDKYDEYTAKAAANLRTAGRDAEANTQGNPESE